MAGHVPIVKPAMNLTSKSVSALCYSMIRERCQPSELTDGSPHNRTVQFVLRRRAQMSNPFRTVVTLLTWTFLLNSLLRSGQLFHTLRHEQREPIVNAWRKSRLSLCREFIRLHESLTVFAWFSACEERHSMGQPHKVTTLNISHLQ